MTDIQEWLIEVGLAKYAPVFSANEIALDSLPELTAPRRATSDSILAREGTRGYGSEVSLLGTRKPDSATASLLRLSRFRRTSTRPYRPLLLVDPQEIVFRSRAMLEEETEGWQARTRPGAAPGSAR